jgi:hypothetical protein
MAIKYTIFDLTGSVESQSGCSGPCTGCGPVEGCRPCISACDDLWKNEDDVRLDGAEKFAERVRRIG